MRTKQKCTQKQLQNAPTFTRNRSHCHVCLLLVIQIKTCTYKLCKRRSADTNVQVAVILPIIGRLSVHLSNQHWTCIINRLTWTICLRTLLHQLNWDTISSWLVAHRDFHWLTISLIGYTHIVCCTDLLNSAKLLMDKSVSTSLQTYTDGSLPNHCLWM